MGFFGSNASSDASSDDSSSRSIKRPRRYCSNAVIEFDEVFDRTRHYGRYQLFVLLVIQYAMINAAGNYVFVSFAALKPSCLDPNVEKIVDTCSKIAECSSNDTVSVFESLYEEDDFVCPNSHLPQHMQTVQAIGSGIGAILGGHLADVYGRKWVSYSGAVLMSLFGAAGGFSMSWEMLLFSMLGMGFSYGMLVDASMTLASETAGPKYRIVQTLAFQWSLALQVASLIAYLTANWRTYLLTINSLCAPVLILMFFWIESPRWLIQKRRYAQAAKELNTLNRWNGVDLHFTADDLTSIQVESSDSAQVFSIWHLVSTRKLICYTIVMFASALTVEMCVAVIIFDVQVLAGNPFMNIALYGILRLWVPLFIVFMEARTNWFGRRVLFISSQSITAICYGLVLALSVYPESNTPMWILRSCLAMIGGIVNSSIFFTVYKQYTIELYPTLMRAMAVGTFGVVERIGGALAPQLVNMSGTAIAVTTVVILLSLVTGFLILPETKNAAMPDAMPVAVPPALPLNLKLTQTDTFGGHTAPCQGDGGVVAAKFVCDDLVWVPPRQSFHVESRLDMATSRKRRLSLDMETSEAVDHINHTMQRLHDIWERISMDEAARVKRVRNAYSHLKNLLNEMVEGEEQLEANIHRDISKNSERVQNLRSEMQMDPFPLGSYEPNSIALWKALDADLKELRSESERRVQKQADIMEQMHEAIRKLDQNSLLDDIQIPINDDKVPTKSELKALDTKLAELQSLYSARINDLLELQNELIRDTRCMNRDALCKEIREFIDDDLLDIDVLPASRIQNLKDLSANVKEEYVRWAEDAQFRYLELHAQIRELWDKCYVSEMERCFPEHFDPEFQTNDDIGALETEVDRLSQCFKERKPIFDLIHRWTTLWKEKCEFEESTGTKNFYNNRGGQLQTVLKRQHEIDRQLPRIQREIENATHTYRSKHLGEDEFLVDGVSPNEYIEMIIEKHRQDKDRRKLMKARERELSMSPARRSPNKSKSSSRLPQMMSPSPLAAHRARNMSESSLRKIATPVASSTPVGSPYGSPRTPRSPLSSVNSSRSLRKSSKSPKMSPLRQKGLHGVRRNIAFK